MSVARFIADQRTNYRVPHTITCLLLGVSLAWFYKWLDRPPTPRQQRRADLRAHADHLANAVARANARRAGRRLLAPLRLTTARRG